MNHGDTEITEKTIPEALNELATRVIGAAIEVHRILGPGYLEVVHEEALRIEFLSTGVPFERQKPIAVSYKDHIVGQARLDFLIDAKLPVELKLLTNSGQCTGPR